MENNIIIKEINGITHYVNPKFEKIMDGAEVSEETGIVNPLFTPPTEEEDQKYKDSIRIINAKKYLSETDWYITRQAEIGTLVPEDVLLKRAQARIDANHKF
jgi:hypothetical protein